MFCTSQMEICCRALGKTEVASQRRDSESHTPSCPTGLSLGRGPILPPTHRPALALLGPSTALPAGASGCCPLLWIKHK